jgi:hypothetical protein
MSYPFNMTAKRINKPFRYETLQFPFHNDTIKSYKSNIATRRRKMGQKDLSEKILEDYNDVFADIINGLVFNGEQRVRPESLTNGLVHSQYKADDNQLHEQERDVTKYWSDCNVELALYGIENQTKVEKLMPLRVIGYEGASYRSQLLQKRNKIIPVVTIVLYFGTETRWNQPTNLKELLDIPDGLTDYVNEYRIHVFEIAWLTDEEIARFKSDFRVVANFFAQKRRNPNYVPDDSTEIEHVDEVLKLLATMTGDEIYTQILSQGKGKVKSMCEVAERLVNTGVERGRAEGRNTERQLLAETIHRLKNGESAESIIASGMDEETVRVAQSCV